MTHSEIHGGLNPATYYEGEEMANNTQEYNFYLSDSLVFIPLWAATLKSVVIHS